MPHIENWEDCLPKFYGNDQITVEKHVSTFQDFIDDLWVEPEDAIRFIRRRLQRMGGVCLLIPYIL